MNTPDIFLVLQWYATIACIGLPFLVLTNSLFSSFFDRGYIFSKIIGIGVLSYTIFLLCIFHLAPFTRNTILFTLFILCIVGNLSLIKRKHIQIGGFFKERGFIIVIEEFLFLGALFFWSWIRTFSPDIHGLEKFMDYGFINSLLRSDYFPPKDMWFTPFTINYYYFGHVMTAVLTKLSGIPSSVTFNLMIASIFAFCFTASFSLAGNLYFFLVKEHMSKIKFIISGILSASLVTFSGNLHVLYTFFAGYDTAHPKPFWQMVFSLSSFPNSYWYPNATRFIFNTIHEFPMYSWVVSDLHGHVLDIPFVLLTIGLLLAIFFQEKPTVSLFNRNLSLLELVQHFLSQKEIIVGFFLGIMYMTNAWDGLIYLFLAAIIFSTRTLLNNIDNGRFSLSLFTKSSILESLVTSPLLLFISFITFSLPFSFFFKPFVSGIGILSAPQFLVAYGKIGPFLFEANHTQHSPWWQLVILYGFFLFFVLSYIIYLSQTAIRKRVDLFVSVLIFLSLFLIFIPEILYVKDIYPEHYRANTMFKLVFQAFIMLSLVSGFIIARLLLSTKKTVIQKFFSFVFFICTLALLVVVFMYPYFAITSYYNNLQKRYSLAGTSYLQSSYPDDYAVINWIQKNIHGQPVILEAQGDSYTDYARISSNTGLPTILGWTVHEWLWRGTYDIPAPRIEEIKTLYESIDLEKTKQLIKKYHLSYIYVGELEQQKYVVNKNKFEKLGKIVFKKNYSTLYKL